MLISKINEYWTNPNSIERLEYENEFKNMYNNGLLMNNILEILEYGEYKFILVIMNFMEYFFHPNKNNYEFNKLQKFESFKQIYNYYLNLKSENININMLNKILKRLNSVFNVFFWNFNIKEYEIIINNIIEIKADNYLLLLKVLKLIKTIDKQLKTIQYKELKIKIYEYYKSWLPQINLNNSINANEYNLNLLVNKYSITFIIDILDTPVIQNMKDLWTNNIIKQYLFDIFLYNKENNYFLIDDNVDKNYTLVKIKINILYYYYNCIKMKSQFKELQINNTDSDFKIIFLKIFEDFINFYYNDDLGNSYKCKYDFIKIIKTLLGVIDALIDKYQLWSIIDSDIFNKFIPIYYKVCHMDENLVDDFHNNPKIYYKDFIEDDNMIKNNFPHIYYFQTIMYNLTDKNDLFFNLIINNIQNNMNNLNFEKLNLDFIFFKCWIMKLEIRIDLANKVINNLKLVLDNIFSGGDEILISNIFNFISHYYYINKDDYEFYDIFYAKIFDLFFKNLKQNKMNGFVVLTFKNIEEIISDDFFKNIFDKNIKNNLNLFIKVVLHFDNGLLLDFLKIIIRIYINDYDINIIQNLILNSLNNNLNDKKSLIICNLIKELNFSIKFFENFNYKEVFLIFLNFFKTEKKHFYLINSIFEIVNPRVLNLEIINCLLDFMSFNDNVIYGIYDLFKIIYEFQLNNSLDINIINKIYLLIDNIIKEDLTIDNFEKFFSYLIIILYTFLDNKDILNDNNNIKLIDNLYLNILLLTKQSTYYSYISNLSNILTVVLLKNEINLDLYENLSKYLDIKYILDNIHIYCDIFSKINLLYYLYYFLKQNIDKNIKIELINIVVITLDNLYFDIRKNDIDENYKYNLCKLGNEELINEYYMFKDKDNFEYSTDSVISNKSFEITVFDDMRRFINSLYENKYDFINNIYNDFYKIIDLSKINYQEDLLDYINTENKNNLNIFYKNKLEFVDCTFKFRKKLNLKIN